MAGAFKYLEPSAPTPDPDVLMSGVPSPAPYSHVPTTGEVSNLSGPTDTFADKVAQGVYDASPLSLIPGAYGIGQTIGEGLRDTNPGQVSLGAAEAMFLGLPGMRNLQKAGRIAPGGRGSEEALQKAQGAWAQGADPRKTWDETGWADGSQFGSYRDGRSPTPVAWHPMDDLEFKNYDNGIQQGTLSGRLEGTEDLLTAHPELENFNTRLRINPTIGIDEVRGEVALADRPGGDWTKTRMNIEAQNPEQARQLLMHETQHLVDPKPAMDPLYGKAPIYGTEAEQIWEALRTDTRKAIESYPPTKSAPDSLWDIASGASAAGGKAPDMAAYLNAPHEVKARMASKLYNSGSRDEIAKGVYPGDIDPWTPEAFQPFTTPIPDFNPAVGYPVDWRHYKKP